MLIRKLGMEEPIGMGLKGTGNVFCDKEGGVASGEEGLGQVDGVGVQFIRMAADLCS